MNNNIDNIVEREKLQASIEKNEQQTEAFRMVIEYLAENHVDNSLFLVLTDPY